MNMYQQYAKLLKENNAKAPVHGTNEDGENVIIEEGSNDNGQYFKVTTCQKNNWLRINTYYQNGDQEEEYKK